MSHSIRPSQAGISDVHTLPNLIFIDGPDGSGKTTLIESLNRILTEHYPQSTVVTFRLPEDTDRVPYRSIIKKGPRAPKHPTDEMYFDLEDAFINVGCFIDMLRKARDVLENDPTAIILCDRSLESIDCYQHNLYKSPDFAMLIDRVRKSLLNMCPNHVTFILKPPVSFIENNLIHSRDGTDALDEKILRRVQDYMDRYRDSDIGNKRYVLHDPKSYIPTIFSVMGSLPIQ